MATGSTGYRIMYIMLGEYLLEEHRETGKMNPRSAKKKKKKKFKFSIKYHAAKKNWVMALSQFRH